MSVDDVPIVLQPNAQHLGFSPWLSANRLTLQHFQNADHITVLIAPHNSDGRHHVGHDDWPPPLLFNIAYGCAALNTWGVSHFVNLVRQHTRYIYYDDQKLHQHRLDHDLQAARQEKKKQEVDSQTPDYSDIILGLWMHNARKGQHQAHARKAEKTQEKVQTWLDSTKD